MKKVFVAATRQNDGKTMMSLGLFNAFQKRMGHIAYMKPVGQQYRLVDGKKIDKDVVLMQKVYNLTDRLAAMSPIAIPRGFTSNYIENGDRQVLINKVQAAYDELQQDKDFVLIEGTGHAGVGSVFDMSNADVAKQLGSKVILVSKGGVGRPIDEIMLNKSVFDRQGVDVLGVIVNKVHPQKYDKINEMVRKGLARLDIPVLGVIPLVPMLNKPSVRELVEDLAAELLSEDNRPLNNAVGKFVIGDMLPHNAIDVFTDNTLLIVPGNREGLILAAICGNLLDDQNAENVSAIIFTDGIRPHYKIMDLLKRSQIPLMLVQEDSFAVATRINNSIFKLRAEELEKISQAQELVDQYVSMENILDML